MNLIETIKNLFSSDEAITTEDGQRVVTFDTILPAIEGVKLFDDPVLSENSTDSGKVTETTDVMTGSEETIIENESDPIINLANLATIEDLQNVIERLIAIEKLVSSVDGYSNTVASEEEGKIIW